MKNKLDIEQYNLCKEILLEFKKCHRNSLALVISGILISFFITINLWL